MAGPKISTTGADARAVLSLVGELGFSERRPETWGGCSMDAVTAESETGLVGAIPYERRSLRIAPGQSVGTIHESVVGVRPQMRGAGLGSAMQEAVAADPPAGTDLLTVFREKPESGAYRWYRANGFDPVMRIVSHLVHDPVAGSEPQTPLIPFDRSPLDDLEPVRQRWFANGPGGYIERSGRTLAQWLPVHPYGAFYSYEVAWSGPAHDPDAIAVVGIGKLHSETDRMEILELSAADFATEALVPLVADLRAHAARRGLKPLRFALAETDPLAAEVEALGFDPTWSFEFLARGLSTTSAADLATAARSRRWRYQAIDYI